MTAVLVALATGMVVGLSGLGNRVPAAWWDAASRWTLRALLLLMGLRLGLDPQVGAGLVHLGGRAAAFAVATAGGALLAGVMGSALSAVVRGWGLPGRPVRHRRRDTAAGALGATRDTTAAALGATPETPSLQVPLATRPRLQGSLPDGDITSLTPQELHGPRDLPVPDGGSGNAVRGPRELGGPGGAEDAVHGLRDLRGAGDGTGDGGGSAGTAGPDRSGEALRLSAAAVLAVAGGWLAGAVFLYLMDAGGGAAVTPLPVVAAGRLAATGSGYALLLLMALYGCEFGRQWPETRASLRGVRGKALVLPLLGGLGSLAGGWVAGRLAGEPPALALAVAAAFGWYSMAGVLVAQLWGPAAGALAFLANVLRELLTVVAVPFLARLAGRRAWLAVLPGGATTMDTTLPVIAAAARDAGTTALAFVHGLILTLLAPALISWLAGF